MAEFRLTTTAVSHIEEIFGFSTQQFGEAQAEAYVEGLKRTLGLLAEFPRMGMAVYELRPGLRRFVFSSHIVFYTPHEHFVLINAIIHSKRNIRRHMFDI